MVRNALAALTVAALLGACSSSKDGSAGFQMVQFLESGKDNLPRNRVLTFTFSAPVQAGQDFAERLKIQNVQVNQNGVGITAGKKCSRITGIAGNTPA